MPKNYFKKSIICFVMISAILLPYFSFIPDASAQQYSTGGSNYSTGSGVSSQDVGYYMKLATPMIPKLQGCKDVLKNGIGKGINAIKEVFQKEDVTGNDGSTSDLYKIWGDKDIGVESVATNSENANKIAGGIKSITAGAKKVADVTASNKLCLDSVGKMIAKMLIKTLTESTVNWINTGNFGESFWPKDRQTYFQDIAKTEILKFNSEINNPTLYPFARAFMQNQARAMQNKFADNAQYSLNKLITDTTPEFTSETFSQDFSLGGWNAWTAMTQVPANNPIGFNMQASTELESRLAGTTQTVAQDVRDSLQEAGGYLGQEQCVSPSALKGMSKTQEQQNLIDGNPHEKMPGDTVGSGSNWDTWNKNHICQKWEYVTPGGMIAQATTKLMDDRKDQLLSVNDLNDAIAAILDAAINKWGGQLMDQGLASLSPSNPNDQFNLNDTSGDGGRNQVETDFGSQGNTTWLQDNPNFNVRTDITQALIDQQRTNVAKLEGYNKELDALIRTIYQLDYCMPGPHPGWYEEARTKLDTVEDGIKSSIPPSQIDSIAGTVAQIADMSGISGAAFDLALQRKQRDALYYHLAGKLATLTGNTGRYNPIIDNNNSMTKDMAVNFLEKIFNVYSITIKKYFEDSNFMPFTWTESVQKFNQIDGYKEIIDANKSEIVFQNANIAKLKALKEGIDNNTYTDDDFLPTGYVIKQFSRISRGLVSGDDVANTNSLYEQAKSEKDYVWNDLLKGPGGCEQELYSTWRNGKLWPFYTNKRMSYPFPILYDYNNYRVNANLPPNTTTLPPNSVTPVVTTPLGITFPSTYMNNKQAFNDVNNTTTTTFLQDIFGVGLTTYTDYPTSQVPITDNFTCPMLGGELVDFCDNTSVYTQATQILTYKFEQNTLQIY